MSFKFNNKDRAPFYLEAVCNNEVKLRVYFRTNIPSDWQPDNQTELPFHFTSLFIHFIWIAEKRIENLAAIQRSGTRQHFPFEFCLNEKVFFTVRVVLRSTTFTIWFLKTVGIVKVSLLLSRLTFKLQGYIWKKLQILIH